MGRLDVISDETISNALRKAQIPDVYQYREAARVGAIMQAVYDLIPRTDISSLDPHWLDFADSQWLGG